MLSQCKTVLMLRTKPCYLYEAVPLAWLSNGPDSPWSSLDHGPWTYLVEGPAKQKCQAAWCKTNNFYKTPIISKTWDYQSASTNCSFLFDRDWLATDVRLSKSGRLRTKQHQTIKRKLVEYTLGPVLLIGGGESWVLACSMAMKSSTCMEGGRLVFCLRDRNMSFMRGLPRPRGIPLLPRPPPRIGAVVTRERDRMRKT